MANQPALSLPSPATPLLVGREREQAVLLEALAAALAGRGSLVLIGGEAGIGKTALAEALLAEAAALGALVLVGRCYDLSETPPYGPWAEALARAPRGDGPPLPAAVVSKCTCCMPRSIPLARALRRAYDQPADGILSVKYDTFMI